MVVLLLGLLASVLVLSSQTSVPVPVTCEYNEEHVPVGETRGGPCNRCTCTETGFMACMMVDCFQPPCENPVRKEGQCCSTCPDVPVTCDHNGEKVPVGETRGGPCNQCTCTETGEMACIIVDCFPPPCENPVRKEGECCSTCPVVPVTCDHDGEKVPVGETRGGPCNQCTCTETGDMVCMVVDCFQPPCENPVWNEGECCPICHDVPVTCDHNGEKVPVGETRGDPCSRCTCTETGFMACMMVACLQPPCENPVRKEGQCCPTCPVVPVTCDHEGEKVPVGETRGGPCNQCTCTETGDMVCMVVDCLPPQCVNPVWKEGVCCSTCPDGPNCKHPNPRIKRPLKLGKAYRTANEKCRCVLRDFVPEIKCKKIKT